MARIDSTISLGFLGRVKFLAAERPLTTAADAPRPSLWGPAPAAAAAKSATTAMGLATSSISVHRGRRGVTTAPHQTSALQPQPAAGGRKPPPLKKHPRARPTGGGGQHGSQAASTSRAAIKGRKRARDPTMTSGFTPSNKKIRQLEAAASLTPRWWRVASEWCWSAWTARLLPRQIPGSLGRQSTSGLWTCSPRRGTTTFQRSSTPGRLNLGWRSRPGTSSRRT